MNELVTAFRLTLVVAIVCLTSCCYTSSAITELLFASAIAIVKVRSSAQFTIQNGISGHPSSMRVESSASLRSVFMRQKARAPEMQETRQGAGVGV